MYMRVPFQIPPECVNTAYDSRGIRLFMIPFIEPISDNLSGSLKEDIEQLPVFTEKQTKFFRDCENNMPVRAID